MTRKEAIEWLLNLKKDIGKMKHQDLWHYEQALDEIIEALKKEPEQRHWVGTPKEFAKKMSQLAESGDPEADHIKADELMCQLLTSLGYGEGVKIFSEMYKWYS